MCSCPTALQDSFITNITEWKKSMSSKVLDSDKGKVAFMIISVG